MKSSDTSMRKQPAQVFYNGTIGNWFGTTVGVRQGCLFSPTLFNIFLERIMSDPLEDHSQYRKKNHHLSLIRRQHRGPGRDKDRADSFGETPRPYPGGMWYGDMCTETPRPTTRACGTEICAQKHLDLPRGHAAWR